MHRVQYKNIGIVGGGIIGLSVAFYCAKMGFQVTLFEEGMLGQKATQAAAGMISPSFECRYGEEKLLDYFLESHSLYPAFIKEIENKWGQSTDFQTRGTLMVAIDEDDQLELNRFHDFQNKLGLSVRRLSPSEISQTEPLVRANHQGGLFCNSDYWVDPVRLVAGLKHCLIGFGVTILEGSKISAIDPQNGKVIVNKESFQFDCVCVATGNPPFIDGINPQDLPIRPIKGQAVEVKNKSATPLRHVVRSIHKYPVYIVPRQDGRLIIGATSEEMGLDAQTTAGAVLDLLAGVWKILPDMENMEFVKTWTGHRPTTIDHAPVIGWGGNKLIYAMGFFRHGILCAPLTGKLICDLVSGEDQSVHFKNFSPMRFESSLRREVS